MLNLSYSSSKREVSSREIMKKLRYGYCSCMENEHQQCLTRNFFDRSQEDVIFILDLCLSFTKNLTKEVNPKVIESFVQVNSKSSDINDDSRAEYRESTRDHPVIQYRLPGDANIFICKRSFSIIFGIEER